MPKVKLSLLSNQEIYWKKYINKRQYYSHKCSQTLLEETQELEPLDAWQKRPRIRAYVKSHDGYLSSKHGDIKEAIALYDAALKLNPDLADVYSSRASAKKPWRNLTRHFPIHSLPSNSIGNDSVFRDLGYSFHGSGELSDFSFICRFQRLIRNILGEDNLV